MKAEEVIETLVYIRQFHEKNDKAMRVIDGLIHKEIRAIKNHLLGNRGGGMNNTIYIIEYYVDYETHGVETILSTEEEAIKYIEKHKCESRDSDYHLSITQKNLFKNHEEAYTERHDY